MPSMGRWKHQLGKLLIFLEYPTAEALCGTYRRHIGKQKPGADEVDYGIRGHSHRSLLGAFGALGTRPVLCILAAIILFVESAALIFSFWPLTLAAGTLLLMAAWQSRLRERVKRGRKPI